MIFVDKYHLVYLFRGSHVKEGGIQPGEIEIRNCICGRNPAEPDVGRALLTPILSQSTIHEHF